MKRRAFMVPGLLALTLVVLGGAACRPHDQQSIALEDSVESNGPATFDALRQLIDSEGHRSIDDLVPRLPPDMRARYVLLKNSGSVQEASVEAPRVILYTEDARFVMAFNGGRDQDGKDDIETYEFDAARGRFIFREIKFPPQGTAGSVAYSEDNPTSCRSCHKATPRPIFDAWPKWPDHYFTIDQIGSGQPQPSTDKAEFDQFLATGAWQGRYKHLIGAADYGLHDRAERGDRANTFNVLVLAQIDRMLEVEIASHPRHRTYAYALEAAIAGCGDLTPFLKPSWRAGFTKTYEQIKQDTLTRNPKASAAIIGLRWLFENHGIKTIHWSPVPTPRYQFTRDASGDTPRIPRQFPGKSCDQLRLASLASPDP